MRLLTGLLERDLDRPMQRPPGLASWIDDRPPLPVTLGLALQQLAIQSIYFVIPVLMAAGLTSDPVDATRFLCLSILAVALWQALQLLSRGPVGSGYPIPATHTSALVGAYALTGLAGAGFGAAGAMVMLAGAACVLLTFFMRRLRVLLPNEVAGVVVMLIGVTLVSLGTQRFGLQPGGTPPAASAVLVVALSLAVMAGVALSRSRAAPFAVLLGALAGVPLALALGHGVPGSAALLAERPWLAWPQPWLPRFDEVSSVPLLSFLIAVVALKATAAGSLVVMQRGCDARWSRPDAAPIRRGLVANGLGLMAAGLVGGAAPGPSAAAVGLSVATGTLARRIVWWGTGLLVATALCPKAVALFVLIPEPVKVAMLFYVAGFIMAQGCQLVTARLLDTRRSLIVAFGLCAGLAVAIAPGPFIAAVPALAAPLPVGALVAFVVHVVTLPTVARRATLPLALDERSGARLTEWFGGVAAAWALKPQTAHAADQSLGELIDLLAQRGTARVDIDARLAEDRVELSLSWAGPPLPNPRPSASLDDLMGSDAARESFSIWVATRAAQGFHQRTRGATNEAWLAFED